MMIVKTKKRKQLAEHNSTSCLRFFNSIGLYIKKLIVSGGGKEPSVLEFDEGLNIICGPSNTGKSYILECIDYLFGSDKIRFDRSTGYNILSPQPL